MGSEPRSQTRSPLTMKDIFNQCQEKKQSHNRLLEYLKKLYQSISLQSFASDFEYLLLIVLQTPEPNVHVHNVLEFVAKFVISLHSPAENKENEQSCGTNTGPEESIEQLENPLLARVLKFLAPFHLVTNSSVRLHVCRLLRLLLIDMNTEASIDDELYESLIEALLSCLKDKVSAIRIEAAKALFRLQDPSNKECPVIKQYIFHMTMDPNPAVREAVLSCIGPTMVTLDPVIDRTRDEKERVRKKAYEFLSDKVHIRSLSISKRVRLLKEGLKDRSDIVKRTVSTHLVPSWLKMCDGSVVNFLHYLDVGLQETEESLEVTQLTLNSVIENQTIQKATYDFITVLNEGKVIPVESLTCENSFYWKYLIKQLQKHDADTSENLLDQIQPELIHFCTYAKCYILTSEPNWDLNKKLDHQFICEQLLEIASDYDLGDIAGSQSLNAMVNDILLTGKCGAALVKPLIACIIKTKLDPEERLVMVAENISNIREPVISMEFEISEAERTRAKLEISKTRVKINELQESLKLFAETEEFSKAQETKDEIYKCELEKGKLEKELLPCVKEVKTEKNDSDTLLKCVTMVTELMTQAPFRKMHPTLSELMELLLVPCLHSPDPAVRKQGVHAVGLCSLLSPPIANTYFVVFLQVSQMDQPSIQLVALRAIFDLLHMHGLEMFQSTDSPVEEENLSTDLLDPQNSLHRGGKIKTVTNIMTILKSQLDNKIDDIRAIAAEGLGRLLLLGHIYSSELLSHMIMLWFNPTTDTNSLLLHFLGIFIPTYAAHGRNAKQCFEDAFIPSLRTVLEAPHTSPLFRVDVIHMAKVLLQLIQPSTVDADETANRNKSELDVQESKPHDRIGEKICLQILKDPDNDHSNQKWSHVLSSLYLSSTCLPVHSNINTLIVKIKKKVNDKKTLKFIESFTRILDEILNQDTSNQNASQVNADGVNSTQETTESEKTIMGNLEENIEQLNRNGTLMNKAVEETEPSKLHVSSSVTKSPVVNQEKERQNCLECPVLPSSLNSVRVKGLGNDRAKVLLDKLTTRDIEKYTKPNSNEKYFEAKGSLHKSSTPKSSKTQNKLTFNVGSALRHATKRINCKNNLNSKLEPYVLLTRVELHKNVPTGRDLSQSHKLKPPQNVKKKIPVEFSFNSTISSQESSFVSDTDDSVLISPVKSKYKQKQQGSKNHSQSRYPKRFNKINSSTEIIPIHSMSLRRETSNTQQTARKKTIPVAESSLNSSTSSVDTDDSVFISPLKSKHQPPTQSRYPSRFTKLNSPDSKETKRISNYSMSLRPKVGNILLNTDSEDSAFTPPPKKSKRLQLRESGEDQQSDTANHQRSPTHGNLTATSKSLETLRFKIRSRERTLTPPKSKATGMSDRALCTVPNTHLTQKQTSQSKTYPNRKSRSSVSDSDFECLISATSNKRMSKLPSKFLSLSNETSPLRVTTSSKLSNPDNSRNSPNSSKILKGGQKDGQSVVMTDSASSKINQSRNTLKNKSYDVLVNGAAKSNRKTLHSNRARSQIARNTRNLSTSSSDEEIILSPSSRKLRKSSLKKPPLQDYPKEKKAVDSSQSLSLSFTDDHEIDSSSMSYNLRSAEKQKDESKSGRKAKNSTK